LWGVQDQNSATPGPIISFIERLLARLRARFGIAQPTSTTGGQPLTVISMPGGSVTVAVGSQSWTVQGGYSQQFQVTPGSVVTLTANPSSGYQFSNWEGTPQ